MAVLMLGIEVWTEIVMHKERWEPLSGVAFSFWGAFSLLAFLGILHPLKMLPLLLVQFTYKLIWLIIVAHPLWTADQLRGSSAEALAKANTIGLVLDVLVIPWLYVLRNLVCLKGNT